jgi:hypothetical protein
VATRQQRLLQFRSNGEPMTGEPFELLCEDHNGTYVLPFPCCWADGAWQSMTTGLQIQVTVVGWRSYAEQ